MNYLLTTQSEGDLGSIIEEAVTEKLERLGSKKFSKANASRKSVEETDTSASTRYIPAAVKRTVSARDGGQCAFVSENGRRCPESNGREFHHQKPYGRGGDHSLENIQLMCRFMPIWHNRHSGMSGQKKAEDEE